MPSGFAMTTGEKQRSSSQFDAQSLLAGRTVLVEQAVCRSYQRFLAPLLPEGLAVLAVGGFGRRELFPHSDVDLLLLLSPGASPAEAHRAALSGFLQDLWDAGLRLSHSVRTPEECCQLDDRNIELSISLLDQRFLAGDAALHARLERGLARFFYSQRRQLARRLCRSARERHARHAGSIHQLEPDIKEAPGGLRDYQFAVWLDRLRSACPGQLPAPQRPAELEAAREFLYCLRCRLHQLAGRDFNRLTFDWQEEIAEADPADLMRFYFWCARRVHCAARRRLEAAEEQASSLLVEFRSWRSRVSNAEFFVSRERVYFRAPQSLAGDPLLLLRLFEFVARHGLRLALDTERRIAEQLPLVRHYFAESRPLWPQLRELFRLPHLALALRAMEETGTLGALFPEWQRVECLVVRDSCHRYTVDEHTLRAVEALAGLREGAQAAGRFSRLLDEIDDPEVLVIALLFHDTGKAGPPGEHLTESVRLAEAAMERVQVPAGPRRMVRRLVDLHLELSAVMNSRDLDDPATARLVAGRLETTEVLKRLALLTYADISAVHPGALTPWRSEQLWRLYLATHRELTHELETDRISAPPAASPELAAFLEGFPVRYLRTHCAAEIEAHLELERRGRARGVALDIHKQNGVYQLTLTAPDRPFLLASIAGALAGFGMNILKAEGFSNRNGMVLDTFAFSDLHRTLELNPSEIERLRVTLERVTLGTAEVKSLLRNRLEPASPGRRPRIPPSVSFDPDASDAATLIEVVAEDRPGLLYDLALTISAAGCNIELVLIDTQAHKALDVFYVTSAGAKLSARQQANLRERLLASCSPGFPAPR